MRWNFAIIEVFGIAIIGIGGAVIWGHAEGLEWLYNWNHAKAAMGLSTGVCFTLTGIVLTLTGLTLDVIWKRIEDEF